MIRKDITGKRFDRLLVVNFTRMDKFNRNSVWLCRCDCGVEKEIVRSSLSAGSSTSCGCKRHPPVRDRILNNINIDGNNCWNWTRALRKDGYGKISYFGKSIQLHRAAYMIFVGPVSDDKLICHKCDNRKCCNPDHLYIGTHKTNAQDMIRRNRGKNQFKPKALR